MASSRLRNVVNEFEPGQPVAAGKRKRIAELDVGGAAKPDLFRL
jgi:hypothetical protein